MNTLPPQPVILQPGMIPMVQSGTLPQRMPVHTLQNGTLPHVQSATLPTQAQVKQSARHIPLARCRSLYLGSAVPLDTSQGLEAVQGPLRERYPFEGGGDVNGIDTWISVFSSGMALQYVNDKTGNTWFPINSLYVCAAVKCVIEINPSGDKNPKFVALDSEAAKNSRHPPMFACIMRRTKGIKVLECHVLICKSNQAAMALVQSCTHAYEHKEGWTSEAPSIVNRPNQPTRLVAAEKNNTDAAPPEFYQQPPKQGFFYTSDKGLVKNYNVFGGKKENEGQRGQGQVPAQGGPPGAPGGPVAPTPVFYPGYVPPGGPPGAPVPFPPPGMMGPPGMGIPGMYPTLPPPPPGYFNDWDRYEGRPVAVLGDQYGPPPPMGPGDYHSRDRRDDYQRGPPQRDDRRKGGRRHSPPRDKRRGKSPPKRRGHSPPRRGHRHEEEPRYSSDEYHDHRRPRTPPADYERGGRNAGPPRAEYHTHPRDERDGDDFVVYAGRYKERFPEEFGKRREDRNHVEYTSNFNPEIVMKGSKDYRGRRGKGGDNPQYAGAYNFGDEDENVYKYERDLPIHEDSVRYPRNDRAFERSLQEERETIGDQYSERGNFETDSTNIEYGMFHGNQRPYRNLEESLGYFP